MISETITSATNPRLKRAARLRDSRERRTSGLTLVDGLRELFRAAATGHEITEVFVEVSAADSSAAADLTAEVPEDVAACVAACVARGARVTGMPPRVFEKLAFGDRNEGAVGVVRFSGRSLAEVAFPVNQPVLVAEAVEKPGNLGAILRSVDAAGLGGAIVCDPRTDPANPATIRASLGTVFSVPLAVASASDVIDWCHASGRRVIVATPEATIEWFAADLTGPVAIVVGSEAEGVSPAWAAAAATGRIAGTAIRLPMKGIADSLNVAVTAAVLAYEAVRQQAAKSGR